MIISNPTGKLGEEIACNYLIKEGYKIIERNFRKGYGEIDIIAIYQNILVFVEVKTRTTDLFGGAKEAISRAKIHILTNTAQFYKLTHKNLPEALRIDAVLISLSADNIKNNIEHVQNITDF